MTNEDQRKMFRTSEKLNHFIGRPHYSLHKNKVSSGAEIKIPIQVLALDFLFFGYVKLATTIP